MRATRRAARRAAAAKVCQTEQALRRQIEILENERPKRPKSKRVVVDVYCETAGQVGPEYFGRYLLSRRRAALLGPFQEKPPSSLQVVVTHDGRHARRVWRALCRHGIEVNATTLARYKIAGFVQVSLDGGRRAFDPCELPGAELLAL